MFIPWSQFRTRIDICYREAENVIGESGNVAGRIHVLSYCTPERSLCREPAVRGLTTCFTYAEVDS